MKKRFITFIVALLALLYGAIPALAAGDLPYVVDNAGLLSDNEAYALGIQLASQSEQLNFDIVIVTVDSLDGSTPMAYADDYYDYNGYGCGENNDGCLLLVSMEDRDWHISTTGFGITALTDEGINYIGDQIVPYLSDGDYYDAFYEYSVLVSDFVYQAKNGDPYDIGNLDQYDDDYVYYSSEPESLGIRILKSIGIGVIVSGILTLIVMSILVGKMKTVHSKAEANDYLVQNSLVITGGYDTFITANVTKTPRQSSSSSGGSSTHTGSSGTSHGGGGGKF